MSIKNSIMSLIILALGTEVTHGDDSPVSFEPNRIIGNLQSVQGYQPPEGIIPDRFVALQVAETILRKIYGEDIINRQKPFHVESVHDYWVIQGQLETGRRGGVATLVLERSNGAVRLLTHGR